MLSLILYLSLFVLVFGLIRKCTVYIRTPQRFKVPTMPAPRTRTGVLVRLLKEVVLFESLFKASIWTWVFAWLFHAGMLFTLIVHLRYLSEPTWGWVAALIPLNKYASFTMLVGLVGLLLRRCFVDRVRVISAPSDYIMLLFFIALPISGMVMRLYTNTDYAAVTEFARGIVGLSPKALSGHYVLVLHVLVVCCLLFVFPFSKLLHAPGVFFSPSRNQRDSARKNDGQ